MSTQITLPEADKEVGDPNPPGDMNSVIIALNAMSATFWVYPTGDESGDDDTANFAAAVTALGSAPGALYVGAGTYYLNEETGPLATNQWIVCAPGVFINWLGTGDCFRWTDTSTYNSRTIQGGGIIGRPIIDGTNDGAGSSALHAGDILGFQFDVNVQNFSKTGDIAVHLDNQAYWTEQAIGIAYVSNNTQDVVFNCGGADTSNGSFDRGDFTFYTSKTLTTGDCITFQNGAYITGGRLRLFGNFASSTTTFTHWALTLTGSAPAGHTASYSGLSYCELDINVESDGGHTYTFGTINFGSSNNAINYCSGNLSFGSAALFQPTNITSLSSQFVYLGQQVGDPDLNHQIIPNQLTVNGQMRLFAAMLMTEVSGTPSTPTGAGYMYVDSNANLNFLPPSGAVQKLTSGLYLCAPSSYAPSSAQALSTTSATLAAVTGAASTVAAGSNGGEISQIATWTSPSAGVLDVANGTFFPALGGTVTVAASGATTAIVTYAGVSGNSLTGCAYVSGSATGTVATGGAVTLTSAAAQTGSFTAPPSGSVVVGVNCVTQLTGSDVAAFALAAHGTVSPVVGNTITCEQSSLNNIAPTQLTFLVTGLTAGDSYNFDLLFATAAGTLYVKTLGQTSTTPTGSTGAPVVMTVQAV